MMASTNQLLVYRVLVTRATENPDRIVLNLFILKLHPRGDTVWFEMLCQI